MSRIVLHLAWCYVVASAVIAFAIVLYSRTFQLYDIPAG